MSLNIAQQNDLRRVVLDFLVQRHPMSFTAEAMARMIARRQLVDFDVSAGDVAAALAFLRDLKFSVDDAEEGFDVVPAWRATAAGVMHAQRREIARHPEAASET